MSIRYEEMAILLIQSQAMEKSIDQLKIEAELAKLMAETAKLNKETFWYPLGRVEWNHCCSGYYC